MVIIALIVIMDKKGYLVSIYDIKSVYTQQQKELKQNIAVLHLKVSLRPPTRWGKTLSAG